MIKLRRVFIAPVRMTLWLFIISFSLAHHHANAFDSFFENDGQMSVDVKHVKIRALLQHISTFADTNIVVSDNVHGRMDMTMNDTSWSDMIDYIVKTQGLHRSQKNNIIIIQTPAEAGKSSRLGHFSDDMQSHEYIAKTLQNKSTPLSLIFYCKTKDQTIIQLVKYGDLFSLQLGKLFRTQTVLLQTRQNQQRDETSHDLFTFKTDKQTYVLRPSGLSRFAEGNQYVYQCDSSHYYDPDATQ